MSGKENVSRQCCLTREVRPVSELIRFVVSPDGDLWPDVDARAEGRGVWVTATADHVAEAARKRAFARGLRAQVKVPDDLSALTRQHLEQRLFGALGLARKAGQIATGATRVREALVSGEALALLTASDAAADGRGKMVGALRSNAEGRVPPHLEMLSSDQLGLALGLDNVIHAALTKGAAAQSALLRALRLARFITPKDPV